MTNQNHVRRGLPSKAGSIGSDVAEEEFSSMRFGNFQKQHASFMEHNRSFTQQKT
jgi:hypothetical protein